MPGAELGGNEVQVQAAAPFPAPRRHALLICNGTFPDFPGHSLPGPGKDAVNLASVLSNAETGAFTTQVLLDRGLLEVRRGIARICAEAAREDTLLIYYSGNGYRGNDGNLYLLVHDSEKAYFYATSLDTEFILSQLRGSRCRRTVLLIDGCYAGAFFENNRGIPNGLCAITACGATEMCSDTPEGGAFTQAVCMGLRGSAADLDSDGRVSVDELHEFVKARIRAGGYQGTPQKWVWNVPEPIYLSHVPRHVFISYAREDLAAADRLTHALEAAGLSVWIDHEGVRSGNWRDRVMTGLKGARAVVMLVSPHSLESNTVRKELGFAANKRVPIIPVQLEEIPEGQWPDWFVMDYDELHQYFLDPERYQQAVDALALAISQLRAPAAEPGSVKL